MDVAYLFKEDPTNDSEELRYSLRSLQNVPHGKVFIVGEKPEWVRNVEYLPVPQSGAKGQNVLANLLTVAKCERASDDLIIMNDDFFIMKKMLSIPNLTFGDMKTIIEQYDERYPQGSGYIDNMKKLYDMLIELGYKQPISYELHIPMVMNRQNILALSQKFNGSLYQFRTLYGNYFNIKGEKADDVKIFLDSKHNHPHYSGSEVDFLSKQAFLSATGGSFKNGVVGDYIKQVFPEKSVYEA